MTRRRLLHLAAWTIGLVLVAGPVCLASYRGSDMLGNVGPASQVPGGLMTRYPLSAYALDYHVDVGVTNPDGIPAMIAQWAAAQLWSATSFLVTMVIDLFTWAFSLDLLGGTNGALAPISQAISNLYENVIGQSWMVVAILLAGLWGIWKALVQRRYTETAGALSVSVLCVLIALFFVYEPQQTIGQASSWTNTVSLAFLSGVNEGSLDRPDQAKRAVSDQLFQTLVYEPWVVLEFGGLTHCVDTHDLDQDGFPIPVNPHDPAADVCRDHLQAGRDGHGGYAPRFLRQPPGSDARKAEYDALRTGQAPDTPQFRGYPVDKADAPAVDAQQEGGAFQRLTLAIVVFLGALGAITLLGTLSLAVILAQVVALVLLGFAPVALVIGIFPGAGHQFFRGWLTKLATAVFIKALYSLVIAIVVAVSAALTAATGSLGFLFAFGLQTLFFWAIFIYRKQITARLVHATTGGAHDEHTPSRTVVQRGVTAATRPVSALVGATRSSGETGKQESALTATKQRHRGPDDPRSPSTAPSSSAAEPAATSRTASPGAGQRPAGASTANANGRRGTRSLTAGDRPHAADGHAPPAPAPDATPRKDAPAAAAEVTPRGEHEDVMRRARELRQRRPIAPSEDRRG